MAFHNDNLELMFQANNKQDGPKKSKFKYLTKQKNKICWDFFSFREIVYIIFSIGKKILLLKESSCVLIHKSNLLRTDVWKQKSSSF